MSPVPAQLRSFKCRPIEASTAAPEPEGQQQGMHDQQASTPQGWQRSISFSSMHPHRPPRTNLAVGAVHICDLPGMQKGARGSETMAVEPRPLAAGSTICVLRYTCTAQGVPASRRQ